MIDTNTQIPLQFLQGSKALLSSIPKRNGTIYFVTDDQGRGNIYLDQNGQRINMTAEAEAKATDIITGYLVNKEFYSAIPISESNKITPQSNKLYIDLNEKNLYTYNDDGYKIVSNTVLQNAVINNNKNYPVMLGATQGTGEQVGALNKAANLTYNPSTDTLSVGNIDADVVGLELDKQITTVMTGLGIPTTDNFVKSYSGESGNLVTAKASKVNSVGDINHTYIAASETIQLNWVAPTFSEVTVATGAVSAEGTGAAVMTGLGTATLAAAITGYNNVTTNSNVLTNGTNITRNSN